MEVSDHFGKYAKVPNPPADTEHKRITITKAYWPEDQDAPANPPGVQVPLGAWGGHWR